MLIKERKKVREHYSSIQALRGFFANLHRVRTAVRGTGVAAVRAPVVGLGVVVVVAVPLLPVVMMVMTMVTSATSTAAVVMVVVVLLLLTGRVMLLPQLLLRLVMLVMHWRLRCGLLLFFKCIFKSQVKKDSSLSDQVGSFTQLIQNQQYFAIHEIKY